MFYTDDTLLFFEYLDGMQIMLDELSNYCKIWKLKVNTSKIKVVIFFSICKYRPEVLLTSDGIELDYTDDYLYLRDLFH